VYAIISVGRHNLFGHQALYTVETLRRFGARIYRTDEDGGVSILVTANVIVVSNLTRKI
jgi:competence protein ComEC